MLGLQFGKGMVLVKFFKKGDHRLTKFESQPFKKCTVTRTPHTLNIKNDSAKRLREGGGISQILLKLTSMNKISRKN